MNARGFALLEWLIASSFVLVVTGALFTAVAPVRDVIARTQHGADLSGGVRAALDLIVADIREAGADPAIGPRGADLGRLVPAVLVRPDLEQAGSVERGSALRIIRVPRLAAQGRLRQAASAGENVLRLETSVRCATGAPACGFRRGDHAVVFTAARAQAVTIDTALADGVVLMAPLTSDFAAEAVLCRWQTTTYGLRPAAGAAERLIRLTDGGAEQPVLDNVVAFELVSDAAAEPARRRLSIRLRAQAGDADLRGPAGDLFVRAGTAPSARRWVPDFELRTDVALRSRGSAP